MSDTFITTEYTEEIEKTAQFSSFPSSSSDAEDAIIMMFKEPDSEIQSVRAPAIEVLEVGDDIGDVTEFSEEDGENIIDQVPSGLPGAPDFVDEAKDQEEEEEPEPVKNWHNDRDPSGFMEYIISMYPGQIPAHDGRSISGCERAINWINDRSKEISEAIRADKKGILDPHISELETMRVNMIRDMVKLKNRSKELMRQHRDSVRGSADSKDELIKEATLPRIQLVMTPFERAITGMIINAVVSAGKPYEEIYEFLKKKYGFTPREELAIMQLTMDMGQPIFKDRGTIGEGSTDESMQGVDFIKNYFG